MLRDDRESQLEQRTGAVTAGIPVEDWLSEPRFKRVGDKLTDKSLPYWGPLRPAGMPHLARTYESWADTRVQRGLSQLSSAEFIVTDRLHVHILSALLGIPHVVLDNNYGKISGYIAQWGLPENAHLAGSVEELHQIVAARDLSRTC
jgi:pyruvyl transferase EpsO